MYVIKLNLLLTSHMVMAVLTPFCYANHSDYKMQTIYSQEKLKRCLYSVEKNGHAHTQSPDWARETVKEKL